jgi:UDP-N-acetylglucosamine 2-epimerase (non-hydrolysing)
MKARTSAARTVSVILGTRPEAIKLAPVIRELRRDRRLRCRVCVTAQHREMLDQVLEVFGIVPDTDLNLMRRGQSLSGLTARAIAALGAHLQVERPDLVLVQGDTTTVFCAALAAFYHDVPVGHVEAGLRTGDLRAPWPEEANRVLTSRLAALHFAPTEANRRNLIREGIPPERIHVTGNTVIDALFLARRRVRRVPPRIAGLAEALQPGARAPAPRLVLITGHRRENFGAGFERICRAIACLAERFPDVHFVYPVHLNPRVREPVRRVLGRIGRRRAAGGNIHLLDPLPYLELVALMDRSCLILTDSGGLQEEAPSLGKPVLVLREVTERPEAVALGTVRLVGTARERIFGEVARLLSDRRAYAAMQRAHNPYGDGKSAPRIVAACRRFLRSPA